MTLSVAVILFSATALAQQPVEPITPSATTTSSQQVSSSPLWRSLNYGMSVESAADILRTIDGIDRVEVISKKGKAPRLKFRQKDSGIDVGAANAVVELGFGPIGLQEVRLVMNDCASTAIEKNKLISDALKTKYSSFGREKIVDADGVEISYNLAFWNDQTRVRMSFEISNPAIFTPVYGAGKVGDLANALAENAANNALAACAIDKGARIKTTLTYGSQAEFQISQAADQRKRDEKREKTEKGL